MGAEDPGSDDPDDDHVIANDDEDVLESIELKVASPKTGSRVARVGLWAGLATFILNRPCSQKRVTYRVQVETNLSISSSCNNSVKMRLVSTCHLSTCYNLLKQLAASLWIKSFDNQLATSLLATCSRLVVNKLSQAMQTHPDIGLLITCLLQDVNRLVPTCAFFWRVTRT